MRLLLIFLSLNLLLYSWMGTFHAQIPFSKSEYLHNANHYIPDPRISGGAFSLVNALGQYDSQWYLRIADKGYPLHPQSSVQGKIRTMGGLLYNFFPLYPFCIALLNFFIRNVQVSAFFLSTTFLLASVYSLYFVASEWFSKKVAIRSIFLLLLFPYSIFLRGYYAEGLRLLLFIWFCYGLTQKKYLLAAVTLALSCVTSGISLFLVPLYWGVLWFNKKKEKLSLQKILIFSAISLMPFLFWIAFCYARTGDAFIFIQTRAAWDRPATFPIFHNIGLLFSFLWLPSRALYGSRIDVLLILLTLCLTYLAKSVLPKRVWLATIVLAFSPLLVQDSVSFGRFSTVFFSFFVYLAVALEKKYYIFLLLLFSAGLLFFSLCFINWYWIE